MTHKDKAVALFKRMIYLVKEHGQTITFSKHFDDVVVSFNNGDHFHLNDYLRTKNYSDKELIEVLHSEMVPDKRIILSGEDAEKFLEHLNNPQGPNEKLKEAFDKYRKRNSDDGEQV